MLYLTVDDVQRLLAPETASDARVTVAEKVALHYAQRGFGAMEALLAEQLFRLLVRDTEARVRRAIAEQVKDSPVIPRDVALALACDVDDSVALPVLRYSEVLTLGDLIELIEATAVTARQVAVCERREVPPDLASLLVERGGEEVAATLLENPGAQLNEMALAAILEKFQENGQVVDKLVHRAGLPPAIVEKVISRVSSEVAEGLKKKYRFGQRELEESTERARVRTTLTLLANSTSQHEINKLVDQLAVNERLTPNLIFTALAQGYIRFFEVSMARLSGTPHENAAKLIHDRGGLGMRAIYNKSGLPTEAFGLMRQLFAVVSSLVAEGEHRPGLPFAQRVSEQLLQMREQESPSGEDAQILASALALVQSVTR